MTINEISAKFQPISLAEMDSVKLMNRTDRKYWFHQDMIGEILDEIANDYYVLEISGNRNLPYATTYYDTQGEQMYGDHHRGKLNRFKIRRRHYISSESCFLEVKFKSNKGRTLKVRRESSYGATSFSDEDQRFIDERTPYSAQDLRRVLENGFSRLMLVSREMNERCTIDSSLRFRVDAEERALENLIVVEVKSDGRSSSHMIEALRRRRIKPSGFSKYFVGRSILDSTLKQNNFKRKLREMMRRRIEIEKICEVV